MEWYWILIILSAVFGPFEAMYALNKARQNREKAEKRREEPPPGADAPAAENERKEPGGN